MCGLFPRKATFFHKTYITVASEKFYTVVWLNTPEHTCRHPMAKKAKNPNIEVRWKIRENIHRRIAAYQKLHGIDRMDVAVNLLLEKATPETKPFEL